MSEHMSKSLNHEGTPFKDNRNRYRTTSLFFEFRKLGENMPEPLYTLKEKDHTVDGVVYPSLKKLYLQEEDVTELEFARKHLYNYRQWKLMCSNKMLLPHIEEWREELEVQIRSKALKALVETATTEGSKGTSAARYIVDRGWLDKSAKKQDTTKDKVQEHTIDHLETFLQRIK